MTATAHTRPPVFLAFEGLDGAGKSTLAAGVAQALDAVLLRTPLDDLRAVRPTLDRAFPRDSLAATLFYAAAVAAASRRVASLMAAGRSVVMDRYWLSTLAYAQALGVPVDLSDVERHLVRPTYTVWVAVPLRVRARRLQRRGATQGKLTTQDAVTLEPGRDGALRRAFRQLLRSHPLAGLPLVLKADRQDPAALVDDLVGGLRGRAAAHATPPKGRYFRPLMSHPRRSAA